MEAPHVFFIDAVVLRYLVVCGLFGHRLQRLMSRSSLFDQPNNDKNNHYSKFWLT